MCFGWAREDPKEHYAVASEFDNLGDGGLGVVVADNEEAARLHGPARLGILHAGMREPCS